MITIGIDPATSCGYAVLDNNGDRITSGAWQLGGRDAHDGKRWTALYDNMTRLMGRFANCPNIVTTQLAYERVEAHGGARGGRAYQSGASAGHNYGGCVAVIGLVCEHYGVPYTSLPVATAKRAAGKGSLSKVAMVTAATRRWQLPERPGEDEADALWIAEALRTLR